MDGPVLALTGCGAVLDGAAAAALEQNAAIGFGFGLAHLTHVRSTHGHLEAVLAQYLASARAPDAWLFMDEHTRSNAHAHKGTHL